MYKRPPSVKSSHQRCNRPAADTNSRGVMKNLGKWAVKDWKELTPEESVSIFRRRHQITLWLVSSTVLLNAALPLVCIKLLGMAKNTYEDLGLHYMGALLLLAVPYTIFRFRCPRCNATPASSKTGASGVPLFPKKCINCNAPLLPNHRWGED